MTEAEDFIYHFEGPQREIMLYLHRLLTAEMNLTEKIRFNIPFYYGRSWICFLNPAHKDFVEFGFVRGNEISNYQGILNSKGRKQVYSVEFKKISDIPVKQIHEIIHEAILLDKSRPYGSKRKKK